MTREEAIKLIKESKEKKFKYTLYTVNEYHAAMEMAINALENENAVLDRVLEIIDKKHNDIQNHEWYTDHPTAADRMKLLRELRKEIEYEANVLKGDEDKTE